MYNIWRELHIAQCCVHYAILLCVNILVVIVTILKPLNCYVLNARVVWRHAIHVYVYLMEIVE